MRYDRRHHTARRTEAFVFHQLIPYLGNKRHLLDVISAAVAATGVRAERATFFDAFAGSGVVSRHAKQVGFRVLCNDWEPYARVLNTAAIALDRAPEFANLGGYERALDALNQLPGVDGWVTNNLCPRNDASPDPANERLFYRRATGRRIDAIRERIATWQQGGTIDDVEACCLLAPLLYQACWLSNTSGVFKGFHAGWGGKNGTALHRILADLHLEPSRFLASERQHEVTCRDALVVAQQLDPVDIAYLDPPYNQHPYASNYHVLNSLTLWDRPDLPPASTRGAKAAIRPDWKERRSPFNHRSTAGTAYSELLTALDAKFVLTSYSTDGMIPLPELVERTAARGRVTVQCRPYKRYRVSPTRPSPRPTTVEFVLTCDTTSPRDARDVERVLQAISTGATGAAEAPA